jgi:hypothetical protein
VGESSGGDADGGEGNLKGIRLTPDHLILTGKTWRQAHLLDSNESILCQALGTCSESLPLSDTTSAQQVVIQPLLWLNALAGRSRIMYTITTCVRGSALNAANALERLLDIGKRSILGLRTLFQIRNTEPDCLGESAHVSGDATIQKTQCLKATEGGVFSCMKSGEKIRNSFLNILFLLKDGMYRNLKLIEQMSIKDTNPVILGLLQKEKIHRIRELSKKCKKGLSRLKLKTKGCAKPYQMLLPVYDIVSCGPRNRFTVLTSEGPIIVHNCGYQGGVGAIVTMAATYKMDLEAMSKAALPTLPMAIREDAEGMYDWALEKNANDKSGYDATYGLSREVFVACDGLKRMWRAANPKIVAFWGQLDSAVRNSVYRPGADYVVEDPMYPDPSRPRLVARTDGIWTKVKLPSGRSLFYPSVAIGPTGEMTYIGQHQLTKKWCKLKNYPGKEAEQATQKFSRDIMAHGMLQAEDAGYEIVLTVHDEILSEAPDTREYSTAGLSALMAKVPEWAPGIPLSAAGFEAYRYRK